MTAQEQVWHSRYSVRNNDPNASPIYDDEPCLVIRGQDFLAVSMLCAYMTAYEQLPGRDVNVELELHEHLRALIFWQGRHTVKVADRYKVKTND